MAASANGAPMPVPGNRDLLLSKLTAKEQQEQQLFESKRVPLLGPLVATERRRQQAKCDGFRLGFQTTRDALGAAPAGTDCTRKQGKDGSCSSLLTQIAHWRSHIKVPRSSDHGQLWLRQPAAADELLSDHTLTGQGHSVGTVRSPSSPGASNCAAGANSDRPIETTSVERFILRCVDKVQEQIDSVAQQVEEAMLVGVLFGACCAIGQAKVSARHAAELAHVDNELANSERMQLNLLQNELRAETALRLLSLSESFEHRDHSPRAWRKPVGEVAADPEYHRIVQDSDTTAKAELHREAQALRKHREHVLECVAARHSEALVSFCAGFHDDAQVQLTGNDHFPVIALGDKSIELLSTQHDDSHTEHSSEDGRANAPLPTQELLLYDANRIVDTLDAFLHARGAFGLCQMMSDRLHKLRSNSRSLAEELIERLPIWIEHKFAPGLLAESLGDLPLCPDDFPQPIWADDSQFPPSRNLTRSSPLTGGGLDLSPSKAPALAESDAGPVGSTEHVSEVVNDDVQRLLQLYRAEGLWVPAEERAFSPTVTALSSPQMTPRQSPPPHPPSLALPPLLNLHVEGKQRPTPAPAAPSTPSVLLPLTPAEEERASAASLPGHSLAAPSTPDDFGPTPGVGHRRERVVSPDSPARATTSPREGDSPPLPPASTDRQGNPQAAAQSPPAPTSENGGLAQSKTLRGTMSRSGPPRSPLPSGVAGEA